MNCSLSTTKQLYIVSTMSSFYIVYRVNCSLSTVYLVDCSTSAAYRVVSGALQFVCCPPGVLQFIHFLLCAVVCHESSRGDRVDVLFYFSTVFIVLRVSSIDCIVQF